MTTRLALIAVAAFLLTACGNSSRKYPNEDYLRCDAVGATTAGNPLASKTQRICDGRVKEAAREAERGPRRWQWF